MAAYKLSKNHWVMPFFVIFRYDRDILLVTVAFDHPVLTLYFTPVSNYVGGLAEFQN